jgi:hypothetical protein
MNEQRYRALAKLDPRLEPWRKCEHEWRHEQGELYQYQICAKCGLNARRWSGRQLPVFGDGRTSHYSSVDALLALCEGLGLAYSVGTSFKYPGDVQALVWPAKNKVSAKSQYAHALTEVDALSEAICRAFGVEVEA